MRTRNAVQVDQIGYRESIKQMHIELQSPRPCLVQRSPKQASDLSLASAIYEASRTSRDVIHGRRYQPGTNPAVLISGLAV